MLTANNEVRAKNAEIALKSYQGAKGDVASVKQKAAEAEVALRAHLRAKKDPDDPVDREDNISDLLTDLLHLAKKEGLYNFLVPKSSVFPNLSDVQLCRAKEIDDLVIGLLHLAQQDGVEDIETLARRAKNNFEAECDPVNEDEIAAFQSIANDLLIKHYGITLDDTRLCDLNVTVECLQQGHRPFEVVNEHARETELDRIDKEGRFGVPAQDPLTAEDEEAVINDEKGQIWWTAADQAEADKWVKDLTAKGCTIRKVESEPDRTLVHVVFELSKSKAKSILGYQPGEEEWLDQEDACSSNSRRWFTVEENKETARASSEAIPEAICVVLCAHGNPDHGQDPDKPVCPPEILPVDSFAEASEKCLEFIEKNNLGSGNWVGGQVYRGGKQVAEVSFNGRVWDVYGSEILDLDDDGGLSPR